MQGTPRLVLTMLLLMVLPTTAACSGSRTTGDAATPSPASQARPRSLAAVAIVHPAPGATVAAGRIRVRVSLEGGRIVPQTARALAPDEGHIHLKLDGRIVSMTSGLEEAIEVQPGPHLLEAEFVAADHLPFNPPVITTVTFTAR